ncbi:MAG TPA: hypothetical protein GXX20_11825 [Clostridiaceae bacterium]|nr:hypothetical protein [Clostridiaceae bacterium]
MPVKVDLLRLENEIIEFKKRPVQKGKILFYGDSYFTRWKLKYGNTPLEEVIPVPVRSLSTGNRMEWLYLKLPG